MKNNNKIDWFWAHRRNTSLHHMSIFAKGLREKGWLPAVNFWFDNQIYVGVPGKGCYIFYDKNQLNGKDKYKDIQRSIDNNPNFVKDFRGRTDELFGALFFKCTNIDDANLELLSNEELYKLYDEFINAITVGPIITVQLWGIEACLDENYKIIKFLQKRLKGLGKKKEIQNYRELLILNTGETVAFTEQKDFYRVAIQLAKNAKIKKLFKSKNLKFIAKNIENFSYENSLVLNHIKKYEWINTEYVSGEWAKEKWIALFQEALNDKISPAKKFEEILDNFKDLNQKRQNAIDQLKPSKEVIQALSSLAELIAQRDWTKGYFTKALLSYAKLLGEMGKRMGLNTNEILNYSYEEFEKSFLEKKNINDGEIKRRIRDGFVILIKNGQTELITGNDKIKKSIKKEKISGPFEKIINISEFKGLAASKGHIKGRVRVVEDASKISEFKKGEILVTYMTTMEFTPFFRKAAAVITDEGGMSCHAAIVSREFNIPCIVGTKIATRVLETGDLVEVDANSGIIKIINN